MSKPRILPDLQAAERIAQLEAQVEALKNPVKGLKVTEKGGVSMYGLGRFPVTLYKSQWDKLIAKVPEIQKFLKDNESRLAVKS